MERNWHPDALKFDLLDGSEKEILKKSLEKTKGNRDNPIEYRLIKGKRQYLDGRNRALCCDELAIKPNERAVNVKDADLRDYFIRKNIARRHLLAKTRQEWVADLRADGQSTRQIAETMGVSHATVQRDLDSTGTNVPVENSKITGKDGKFRAAATKKPLLCDGCKTRERKGQALPGKCKECAKVRKDAKKDKGNNKDADVPEETAKAPPMDDLGAELPKKLRDTFAGNRQTITSTIKLLQEARRMLKGLGAWNPFIREHATAEIIAKAIDDIKNGMPYAICPECESKGCAVCRKSGWVTKWKHLDPVP